jgi:hypothetical protein
MIYLLPESQSVKVRERIQEKHQVPTAARRQAGPAKVGKGKHLVAAENEPDKGREESEKDSEDDDDDEVDDDDDDDVRSNPFQC